MRPMLFESFLGGRAAIGLLIVRLIAGAALIIHGWQKVGGPAGMTGWMGDAQPGWLQAIAAIIEFGGGIALILGLLTPLVGLAIMAQMVAAYVLVHGPKGDPFVGQGGGGSFELAALYLAVGCLALLAGPGTYSLDYALWGRRRAAVEVRPEMRKTA